jgi:hypothetical protein
MVAERFWFVLWLLIPLILSPVSDTHHSVGYAQVTPVPDIVIVAPQPGQALQGVVAIMGRTTLSGFLSAEVLFGYANDPSQTWFFIAESTTPVDAGLLAEWDTSTLTDGNYTLRLVVNRTDGSRAIVIVPGLRVRNYSPVETSTPTPLFTPNASATPLPGGNVKSTQQVLPSATLAAPTLTPLPTNPAELSQQDISRNLWRGAAGTGIALAAIGLYLAIRKFLHR